jgi:DNA transposition AAA+ family ATPase
MDKQVDQVASALGALPNLSSETHKELERLSKPPYFPLPKVKSCHAFLEECRLGKAHGRIVGDSGVGKTVAVKAYAKRLKEVSGGHGVLYILLDPNCSPKGIYETILESLGFTYKKGNIKQLRNRTRQVLSSRQISVLLIDEASFLKTDALEEMLYLEEAGVVPSIFLIGTDRLDALLDFNEQIARRYPRYQYGRVSNPELKQLVELWEQKVVCLPVKSNLTSPKPMKLLISATSGCIGKMDEILRRSARKALILGESKISYEILQEVAGQF